MSQNLRIRYYDTIKFFALLVIYTTHFIAYFCPDAFRFWTEFPTSLLLGGLSGKFGVALFGVILGMFAFQSGNSGKRTLLGYSVKRYIFFFVCGFIINLTYWFFSKADLLQDAVSFKSVVAATVLVTDEVFPTYWCARPYLFASVIAYFMGQKKCNLIECLILVFVLSFVNVWISICLMGTVLFLIKDNALFKKDLVKLLLFVAVFFFIKREESRTTYIIDGICSVAIVILVENCAWLNMLCTNSFTSSVGERSMAIFLIHPLTYTVLGQWILDMLPFSGDAAYALVWFICFIVIAAIAFPLNRLLIFLSGLLSDFADTVLEKIGLPVYSATD